MRRKRPPALSFLLRMDTLRARLRVVSLLALDLLALFLAIFTALCLKAGRSARSTTRRSRESLHQTEDLVSVRVPRLRRCCSRARACTRSRGSGPG